MASYAATLVGARKLALDTRNFRNFSLARIQKSMRKEKKKKGKKKKDSP